jgi:hypothetical protein
MRIAKSLVILNYTYFQGHDNYEENNFDLTAFLLNQLKQEMKLIENRIEPKATLFHAKHPRKSHLI